MQSFGNYKLERLLGQGGMAEVFLATRLTGANAGTQVALKRLKASFAQDPTYTDLFLSEADINRTLVHPNIVRVLDAGSVDDTPYMAMEYIQGPDLGQVLEACNRRKVMLPLELACHIAHMVANGLHFAHIARSATGKHLGIVHCDVTPSNIFVGSDGRVRLADFGVATTQATGSAVEKGLAGKPQYFAPELLLGEPADPTADVFALGVILYEMFTGVRPFDGESFATICDRIVAGKPERPSNLRPELTDAQEEVTLRALRRRKDDSVLAPIRAMVSVGKPNPDRYHTADDMGRDLAALYDPRLNTSLALASVLRGLFKKPSAG